MPTDIRERLHQAVGPSAARPDPIAAMRRGDRLRRRRTITTAVSSTTAVVAVVGVVVLLLPPRPPQLPPVGDRPAGGSIQQLDVFERPARNEDRLMSVHYRAGTPDPPGVHRRTPRLDAPMSRGGNEGLADRHTYPLDIDMWAARLAWQDEDLTVHLAPPTGDPVDPELQPLDGDWLYVVLDRPGTNFTGSAPVPEPGTAAWAGSVTLGGTVTAILVVGDGLDEAHGPSGTAAVQDNVVLVEDLDRGDQVTLTGPAGDFALTLPS